MLHAPKQLKALMEQWPAEVVADILATILQVEAATGDIAGKIVGNYIEFDYDYLLGAAPQLIENYNDLKEIKIVDYSIENFKDITETAGIFEIAEQLYGGKYTLLYNTTSNSGGVAYYIPSKYYMSCNNIIKSIALSNEEKSDVNHTNQSIQ
jgi:hypothetical protein